VKVVETSQEGSGTNKKYKVVLRGEKLRLIQLHSQTVPTSSQPCIAAVPKTTSTQKI